MMPLDELPTIAVAIDIAEKYPRAPNDVTKLTSSRRRASACSSALIFVP